MKHRLGNRRVLSALSLAVHRRPRPRPRAAPASRATTRPRSRPGSSPILIGSSGDAETQAVQDAVAAWAEESGVKAEVTVASDLAPAARARASPATTRRTSSTFDRPASRATPATARSSRTATTWPTPTTSSRRCATRSPYDDEFCCAPKDFSTLALVINTKLWKQAGLTEDDIPTTWDELRRPSREADDQGNTVGLVLSPEYQRVGVFFEQTGGWHDQRGRHRGHRGQPRERRGPHLRAGA